MALGLKLCALLRSQDVENLLTELLTLLRRRAVARMRGPELLADLLDLGFLLGREIEACHRVAMAAHMVFALLLSAVGGSGGYGGSGLLCEGRRRRDDGSRKCGREENGTKDIH